MSESRSPSRAFASIAAARSAYRAIAWRSDGSIDASASTRSSPTSATRRTIARSASAGSSASARTSASSVRESVAAFARRSTAGSPRSMRLRRTVAMRDQRLRTSDARCGSSLCASRPMSLSTRWSIARRRIKRSVASRTGASRWSSSSRSRKRSSTHDAMRSRAASALSACFFAVSTDGASAIKSTSVLRSRRLASSWRSTVSDVRRATAPAFVSSVTASSASSRPCTLSNAALASEYAARAPSVANAASARVTCTSSGSSSRGPLSAPERLVRARGIRSSSRSVSRSAAASLSSRGL